MQPGVSCAGGGQGAQLPPPRGAVCVCVCVCVCVGGVLLGQADVEAEGRSQGRPGYPPPGEFSDAQGGAWSACFQTGRCGWLKPRLCGTWGNWFMLGKCLALDTWQLVV